VVVASAATAGLGCVVLRREVGVRLRDIRAALSVAVLGALLAAGLWAAGVRGWPEGLVVAAAVMAAQFRQLAPGERRWLADRLARPGREARR
jgi:hypothetical protein